MSGTRGPEQQKYRLDPPPAAPLRPTGWQAAVGFARTLTKWSAFGGLALYAGQAFLPDPYKPATVIGNFHGSIEAAEINAKAAANIAYQRGVAEAQAQAQAKWQMESAIAQKQQEVRSRALEGQESMANGADVACALGLLGGLLFSESNPDAAKASAGLGAVGCVAGQALRENMNGTLAQSGNTGSSLANRTEQAGQPDAYTPATPFGRPAASSR